MRDILYARDCICFFKGDTQTVTVSPEMAAGGWPGGQGVQWVDSPIDDRVVTYSSGLYGGFLVWGSDEEGDRFTAITRQQPQYRYATMFSGGLIATSSYEKYTYASRLAGPPYVSLVYAVQDILYLSLRGLWTKEDELTLSGSPLAPAFFTGFVARLPRASNRFFMGIQASM